MKEQIEKLIKEYQLKVEEDDTLEESLETDLDLAIDAGDAVREEDIRDDLRPCRARRHAYIQCMADLKSLIGVI